MIPMVSYHQQTARVDIKVQYIARISVYIDTIKPFLKYYL